MAAAGVVAEFPHLGKLNDLFYRFRLAKLNARYNTARLKKFESLDRGLQAVVAVTTASAFAVLAFSDVLPKDWADKIRLSAAVLSVIGFLAATAAPWFGLSAKTNEARTAAFAWNAAALQLESALRNVKAAAEKDSAVAIWMQAADDSYRAAAGLPFTEDQDSKLVKDLTDEINRQFPPDYVWTAF
jgi:uncharacterized membrane protein YhiD involved in acid resistance